MSVYNIIVPTFLTETVWHNYIEIQRNDTDLTKSEIKHSKKMKGKQDIKTKTWPYDYSDTFIAKSGDTVWYTLFVHNIYYDMVL